MIAIKQNDTRFAIEAVLSNENGTVDLTGATVLFLMADANYKTFVNREADIKDAENGEVWFLFKDGETSKSGNFKAEFEVTFNDGRVETYPNDDYINITIKKDLG